MGPIKASRNLRTAAAVSLGLLGEELLSRRHQAWTLWGGLVLLGFSLVGLWRLLPPLFPRSREKSASLFREWMMVLAVLAVGIFFRWYQLDRIPSGIFLDQAGWGWGAEKILYDGWRPLYDGHWRPFYETAGLGVWELFSYYLLAAWFWVFEPSRLSLFSFSNAFSLLGALFAYWVFRQWGPPRTAGVALFFMVALRWYLNFSRCAHPTYDAPFYLCGTLAFWLYAHRTWRWWAWLGCLLFLSLGFYAYPSLLAMPLLMAAWAFYEWKNRPRERKKLGWIYAGGAGLTLVLSLPVWGSMLARRSFGMREEQDWFFARIHPWSAMDLFRHLARFLLMFDRQGDWWPVHNWPDDRTIDGVTGFLFLLGLTYALRYWREKIPFYCLSGLAVMALPGLLGKADTPASHVTGMIPFMVYLAAWAFGHLWETWDQSGRGARWAGWGAAGLLLGAMAGNNFYDYFYNQGRDPEVVSAFYPDATAVGERVENGTEKEVFLSPKFFRNFDVDFLAYRKSPGFQKLDFWNLPLAHSPEVEKDMLFALDEGKTGVLNLLQKAYPGGKVEVYEYFKGWPLVYFYHVPAGSPQMGRAFGGIQGIYRLTGDGSGPPALIRTDPCLNFTFRNDFGLAGFETLSVQWTGYLRVSEKGNYSFLSLTTDQSSARVDGRKVLEGSGTLEGTVSLTPGAHRVQVDFLKISGVDAAFSFLWKTPQGGGFQVVPFWQMGPPTAVQRAK